MGKIKQTVKTKTKYRKSKTTTHNGRRRCNSCGRFM